MSALADHISRFCYITTVLFNSLLIYLTVSHTKQIVGTYRNMIVIFASFGIWFANCDILVRPLLHSYNGSFIYFTLGSTFRKSKEASEKALLMYGGMYGLIMGFLVVQFCYRTSVIAFPKFTKNFDGWKLALWTSYACGIGATWANGSRIVAPDEYAYQYVGHEIMAEYGVNVRKTAMFAFLAYNPDGSFRRNTLWSLATLTTVLMIQYNICLVCGIIMYRRMQGSMSTFSCQHEKLQKQFFVALLYQVLTPLFCFHLPAFVLFMLPYLDLKMSFHSTVFIYGFSTYPVLDSLILLCVVSEYKNALRKFGKMIAREWEATVRNDGIPEPSMSVVMTRM